VIQYLETQDLSCLLKPTYCFPLTDTITVEFICRHCVLSNRSILSNKLIVTKEVPLGSSIGNGRRVGDKRNAIRLDCDYKCLLQHNDIMYPCQMNNFSISGALVCTSFLIPINMQLGDACDLLFTTHRTMTPLEFKSKVTRLEDSKIALHFLYVAF
jgi:hypothetical protein